MKDEALKLALEALEESHPEAYRHTITAIKQALAAPAQGCNFCNHPLYAGTKCKNCGRETAQPAPVQEPVQPVWDNLPSNKDVEEAMRMKRINRLTTPPAAQRQSGSDK